MLDKSIPYKNVLMRATGPLPEVYSTPPENWRILPYEAGDEAHWAEIETSVGEFENEASALAYFERSYLPEVELLQRRCMFAVDNAGHYAGTCTAWHEQKDNVQVGSLHWLAVKPEYQHHGLASALISKVMTLFAANNDFPVYLHTQTWSHRAILLYRRFGFCLLQEETFAQYHNDYAQALAVLEPVFSPEQYADLIYSAQ